MIRRDRREASTLLLPPTTAAILYEINTRHCSPLSFYQLVISHVCSARRARCLVTTCRSALANGFPIPQKEEHVSREETSRGSVNICVSHLGTNLGRHKIGTRQQGLQSPPGNSTVMGIIRNNFSHTGYNARREGSHRGKWVNHDEIESKENPTPGLPGVEKLKSGSIIKRRKREKPNHRPTSGGRPMAPMPPQHSIPGN